MQTTTKSSAFILGVFVFLGLSVLGYLLGSAAIEYKEFERTVKVKGLAEREVNADIVLWPIEFITASNDLNQLYEVIENNSDKIKQFLINQGITETEITFSSPAITDKIAQQWSSNDGAQFRYSATQKVTVYSKNIASVRAVMSQLSELGKQGIVFTGDNYEYQTQYIYTGLNQIKPEMVEEATHKARQVAEKFASDSDSQLGKIKTASQGQFSISDRDSNNPHIKKVRVVSTVEYYLSD